MRPQLSLLTLALRSITSLGLPLIAMGQAAAQGATPVLPPVEVIGTSPLPGQVIDRELLPYSTQSLRRDKLDEAKGDNMLDFMNRRMPSVQVNDVQGSPFQGDLTFRGSRASPLLGAGQGLSVYLDGVRINEPFGDVVNFDMLPEFSIASVSLVPGANPAFGLNSLGGALSYTTFDGRTAPGLRAEFSAGSFGRKRLDLSYGKVFEGGWHAYVAGTAFDEDGWRDESEGKLGNVLAKIGRDDGTTSWHATVLHGRSKLIGNGLVPAYTLGEDGERVPDLYANREESVYTHPDLTRNEVTQFSLDLQHQIDADTLVSALLYTRKSERTTVNGDEADEATDEANAAFNTTATDQTGQGAALSLSRRQGAHQWQVGATVDHSKSGYRQLERDGLFTDSRGVEPAPGSEAELSADVDGKSTAFGVYATDTWSLTPRTHVTATARYNRARVSNQLTTRDDDTDEIENQPRETFNYNSVNPAIGIAHRLETGPTLFANVARNNRVPTVIELGCADPEEPCRLPAGLQADPFLEQVISTTVEAGARWTIRPGMRASVAAFRTDNKDDILFRSVSVNGQLGYFANFPKTRYQGLEAEFASTYGALDVGLGYSLLKATYEANGVLRQGERNVTITPGTRIAGLPRHTLKLAADWRLSPELAFGGDLVAVTRRGTSGNEDGLVEDPEDGEDGERANLGLPGYAVFNLRAAWKPSSPWEIYAKVNNVFDKRYETFGALAETQFSPTGDYVGEDGEREAVFVAPGTPRSFFVGVRYRF